MFRKINKNPIGTLAEALRTQPQLEPSSKPVRFFKRAVGWEQLAPESRYDQRQAVYHQAKALGLDKGEVNAALQALLPVASPVQARRLAKKDAARAQVSGSRSVAQLQEVVVREQAALKEMLRAERSNLVSEFQELRSQLDQDRLEVARERASLSLEREEFAQEVEEHDRLQAEIDAPPVHKSGYVKVDVAGEVFEILKSDVEARGGFLRAVFSGAFRARFDEDGVYCLGLPYVTRDDFRLVAQYIAGDLPSYIAPEGAARLTSAAKKLHLEEGDVMLEVGKRTVDLAAQSAEVLKQLQKAVDAIVATQRPPAWEVTYNAFANMAMGATNAYRACPPGWEPIGVTTYQSNGQPVIVMRRPLP